jgi:hypothetical protein
VAQSPILGGFSRSRSTSASDNEAYNLYLEVIETKDGKVPGALYLTAGLDLIGTLGPGPVRGVKRLKDVLYVVSGNEVYSLTPNGTATLLGQVVIGSAPVSMFENGQQIMIVDGVGGWLAPGGYPVTGGTITGQTTNPSTGAKVTLTGLAGGLYAVDDTITLQSASGTQTSYPILTVTAVANNPVTVYTLVNPGTTYASTASASTTGINGQVGAGSGLTLNVTAADGVVTAATAAAGGAGYAVGDTGLINVYSEDAVYQVTAESGGAVSAVQIIYGGTEYGTASAQATKAAPGVPASVGTGLTFAITASSGPITASSIVSGGKNYVIGNVGKINGGSADAIYRVSAVGATGMVTGFTVTQGGTVNDKAATFTQKSTSGSGAGLTLTAPTYGAWLGLVPVMLPFANPLVGGISDGFGVLVFQGTQYLASSDELDLSTWEALAYGVSDSSPDQCMSLAVIHDEIYLIKEKHTEIWIDAGLVPFPFQLVTSARMESGTIAPFSAAALGEHLFFLSRNDQGQGIVVRAQGYNLVPVSTQALIAEFDTYPNLGDAIGYGRQQGGHQFYVLTFPEANKTWVHDLTASEMAGFPLWHRIAAWTDGAWNRHAGNCFTPWQGAVTRVNTTTAYQAQSVKLTTETLATASGLVGLPTAFFSAVFSVWLNLPDTGAAGVVFSNQGGSATPGLSLTIKNDAAGSPQITVEAWDSAAAPIVAATYDFTNWVAWVNILISIDTATQQLQVYANTLVANVLTETLLTAASITWSSSHAIAPAATQPWSLVAVA